MEFYNASEMLASVLKDMNEIINGMASSLINDKTAVTEPDKAITESYNGYELLPNDEETMVMNSESVEDKLIPEKIVHDSEFPADLKSDRNGSYTAEPFANGDQDNEDAKKYPSSTPEGHYYGVSSTQAYVVCSPNQHMGAFLVQNNPVIDCSLR
ncbi:hypothetical protein FGIG_04058 [Fasciola gigantica]|uniref:Uncharacterized protein n=1 Tax=Fasciola gigantica TaxID=46835 RepID=A0A504Z3F1_FASGI|nr:hypothetical protein FGIG_04058 [Fasciola gigantica]